MGGARLTWKSSAAFPKFGISVVTIVFEEGTDHSIGHAKPCAPSDSAIAAANNPARIRKTPPSDR